MLSHCAKASLLYFGYNFYQYYKLTNLDKNLTTSPQINLDFMPINKDLESKNCLFFGSINKILLKNKEIGHIHLYQDFEAENKKNHTQKVKNLDNLGENVRGLRVKYEVLRY